jgi:hypothetical protein
VLNFDPTWRFQSPGKIASGVRSDFAVLIKRVSGQFGNRQTIIEHSNATLPTRRAVRLITVLHWAGPKAISTIT